MLERLQVLNSLRKYSNWLALALIPLLGASYWYAATMLRAQRSWELLNLSNLTINYLLTFIVLGWFAEKLGKKLFARNLIARWAVWGGFMLGLILWLKLWGYPMRI